jgi:hypothetical protein
MKEEQINRENVKSQQDEEIEILQQEMFSLTKQVQEKLGGLISQQNSSRNGDLKKFLSSSFDQTIKQQLRCSGPATWIHSQTSVDKFFNLPSFLVTWIFFQ